MIYSQKRDKQNISICQPVEQNCLNCNVPEDCLPLTLAKRHIIQLNKLLKNSLALKPKAPVLKQGELFSNFYIVKSGGLKASLIEANGQERILEFYVPGEIVGFEALDTKKYPYDIVSLCNTELCEISFDNLLAITASDNKLHQQLLNLASRRMNINLYANYTNAEQRLAAFLLTLSNRLKRDIRKDFFNLPMSRQDIGSHLGLATETISRIFTRWQKNGAILVNNRSIKLDVTRLQAVLNTTT